ncbi:MAG: HNH endonuclease [Polyangiaceae bacterium]
MGRKRVLWEEQGGLCWYCRKPVASRAATVDHVRPRSKGGTNARANLVMACARCNRRKGSKLTHRTKTPGRLAVLRAMSSRDVLR